MKSMAVATLLALSTVSMPAFADDEQEDLDSGSSGGAKQAARKGSQVREVNRGVYVKANVGTTMFLGRQNLLEPGTAVALTLGQDFIDKERASAAWEVFFHQSLNNGAKYFVQSGLPPQALIQGDIHTFTGGVAFEYSTYLSRRLGLGIRAGGGVSMVPLLMLEEEYLNTVVNQTWGSTPPPVHNSPVPVVLGGPTIEYYTKLSHFSVGIDANAGMYIGLALAVDATGYLKYTF